MELVMKMTTFFLSFFINHADMFFAPYTVSTHIFFVRPIDP